MFLEKDILFTIALNFVPKIGPTIARKLIERFGSAEDVFLQKTKELKQFSGVGPTLATALINRQILKMAEQEMAFCEKHKIDIIHYKDKKFPSLLNECDDAPTILFSKGDLKWENKKVISIVGTRKASEYGKQQCERLIRDLTEKGYQLIIISGLAIGIDGCAHKAALKYGQETIAVVAHGFREIYPVVHRKLASEITSHGSIITEFFSDTRPEAFNFVRRNRLIAAISPLTVVIESPLKGGSMITASLANSYNRDVFAFPGKVTDIASKGCNMLIKTNRAALIESADDLENFMSWQAHNPKPIQPKLFKSLTEEEKEIIEHLTNQDKLNLNTLVKLTGIPINKISLYVINLEMEGVIKSLPGNFFKLI
ncbi:MAG TPA: DNA-protecting protein DprA [Bacteroidales bacterium]|nr:DNA-protecting protein DprA [Bacteroidales bacterium]